MRRWLFGPVIWVLDVLVQWAGAGIDAACEAFDFDIDPEADERETCWCGSEEVD